MAVGIGKFPQAMLDAWNDYDYVKHSTNDKPGRRVGGANGHLMAVHAEWNIT